MTPIERREEELILDYYQGDKEAFNQFARLIHPWLLFIARLNSITKRLAEEFAQELLVRIYEASLRGVRWDPTQGRLRQWLKTILDRLAVDQARAQTRDRKRFGVVAEMTSVADPNNSSDDEATLSLFTLALILLSPQEATLVKMNYGEGKPLTKVGRRLRKSKPAVSRLHARVQEQVALIERNREAILGVLSDDEIQFLLIRSEPGSSTKIAGAALGLGPAASLAYSRRLLAKIRQLIPADEAR